MTRSLSPANFPGTSELRSDTITWGPDIPTEESLRLLGTPKGKRILQLGVGQGHHSVALARAGAHVIGIDPHLGALDAARTRAEESEVRIELHQSDYAEIPFVRADSIDCAFSVFALHKIDDVDRVLRQVSRVVKSGGTFVVSVPHPAWAITEHHAFGPPRILRSYGDGQRHSIDDVEMYPRSVAEMAASFTKANFRVDQILEPMARPTEPSEYWSEVMTMVPATLILRGKKEGS